MGQSVSLNTCISGGAIVRVMKTDGEFASFDFPCVAAEVMMQHAGHLVVHCTPVDRSSIGQRSKITIMLPDQPLMPGQPYMLFPIPETYKKTLARSKSFSMLKKAMESDQPLEVSPEEKRQGRRKALKMIATRLHLATFVARKFNENPEASSPLLENHDNSVEQEQPLPVPSSLAFAWRPNLSSIPESPLGFHSLPQSPLGLYKMDPPPLPVVAQ